MITPTRDAMSFSVTMPDHFGRLRTALETGDFENRMRSWVIAGVALFVTALGTMLTILDIRNGEYLIAGTTAPLPLLMMICVWLLSDRNHRDAAANVLVVTLFAAVAAPIAIAGGYAPGAYAGVLGVVVLGNIILTSRAVVALNVAAVTLMVLGLWLTTRSWHFPAALSPDQFIPRLVRVAVAMSIVIPLILMLYRRASDQIRDELIEAKTDANEAGDMLSSVLAEHLASIHLLSRLQTIGKLGGWWYDPESGIVHHTIGTAGSLGQFHLEDTKIDVRTDGLSRTGLRSLIAEVMEKKGPWDREVKVVDATGKTRWYRSIGELEFEGHQIAKIFGVMHDVTEIREAQAQQSNGQKLEAIGTLAAGMAHEINTPAQFVGDNLKFLKDSFDDILALNQAYSDLVEAAHNGPPPKRLVEKADEAAESADPEFLIEEIPAALNQSIDGISRISHIVRAMKDFAHPGGDAWEIANLNKVVTDMVTVATNEWKYAADVETDLDENLPSILCSPQDLAQVVLNLIVNAAHAIAQSLGDSPTEKGLIRITTETIPDGVELRVSDNGCGIPDELRERVFEPFFTTKEVGKGTGQGLAMAHKCIVVKHHGDLQLESRMGEGSTFIIRLPLENQDDSKDAGATADTG
ncbi:MAG: sensor histidine kinase [Woeseiaceae bacterium]